MNGPRPPALASWLLTVCVPGDRGGSLIRDLVDEHRRRRSSAWFWRQVTGIIAKHVAATLWAHKWLAASVFALNTILPSLFVSFVSPWVIVIDSAWYPRLMAWLLDTELDTVRHAMYGLTTGLTAQVTWCALVFVASWIFVRLRSDTRRLVVALFVVSAIGQCMPGLRHIVTNWLRDPANLTGFVMALRFVVFTFVAIPLSVRWGGRAAAGLSGESLA